MDRLTLALAILPLAVTALEAPADLRTLHDQLGLDEAPSAVVAAVAQTSAELPCNLTSPLPGDKVRLVLWFLAASATPLYTYDTRGKSYLEARHWSDDTQLEGRAFFRGDSEPGRLVLDNVSPGDAGLYKCRVDFRTAPTRLTGVLLDVLVPPEKPVIFGPGGEEVRLKLGPFRLGRQLVLTCAVLGGRPSPKVTWWRDHRLVDSSHHADSKHRVSNQLELGPLRRADLHSIFTCQAANNNVSVPVSTSVKLDLTFGPRSVRLVAAEQPMSAGRERELVCEAEGGRPGPVFSWWRAGVRVEGGIGIEAGPGLSRSSLVVTPRAQEDGTQVVCKAELPGHASSAMETSLKMQVTYVPQLQLALGSPLDRENIKEGNDVYFECSVRARPAYTRISWWRDGHQLWHDIARGTIISNQSIVMQGVKREHSGNYTCRVANSEGEGVSNTVALAVQFAPVCAVEHEEVHGVSRTEQLDLTCRVLAHPAANLSFHWLFSKGDERLPLEGSGNRSVGTVQYRPRSELDYGTLLCRAENTVGRQVKPCVFHVVPAGRPDPVTNCTVSRQAAASFNVQCSPGFDGGAPQVFHLEVVEMEGNTSQGLNFTSRICRFSAAGLRPVRGYLARVVASNAHGRSRAVALQAFTTAGPGGPGAVIPSQAKIGSLRSRLNISPVLGVLIGVGSGLLLVAAVLGSLLCCRARYTRLARGSQPSGLEKLASPDLIPGMEGKGQDRRYSGPGGARATEDYDALQQIHSTLTVLRPTSLLEPEVVYARVRRGRGQGGQVVTSSSESEADTVVSAETPLVTSYSTESEELGGGLPGGPLEAALLRAEAGPGHGDRESRV